MCQIAFGDLEIGIFLELLLETADAHSTYSKWVTV